MKQREKSSIFFNGRNSFWDTLHKMAMPFRTILKKKENTRMRVTWVTEITAYYHILVKNASIYHFNLLASQKLPIS